MVVAKLEKAWERRLPYLKELSLENTDAFRFFSAESDGIDGFVVECFGPLCIFQFHEGKCDLSPSQLSEAARWCQDKFGIGHVYLKNFQVDRSRGQASALPHKPLLGEAVSRVTALEGGKKFWIRPEELYSVGLFLDQRLNRKMLSQSVRPSTKVLNLFSYTCSFSVYCGVAGAQTTSVDVSAKYLEWGKENFAANGLSLGDHRFFTADARYFLKAALKRGEKYGLIILDPPSFARGKNNEPFSVRKNLGEVLIQCRQVLETSGTLFVSTNFSQWAEEDLEKVIEKEIGQVEYLPVPHLPLDYRKQETPIIYRWLRPMSGLRRFS
jgi:23S rRNA (cytosine1962-C5)-methyltransferase